MNRSRLQDLIKSFESKSILVIGDLMLDEFIWGNVKRISPEAPVPVVEVVRESYFPGGAANVARNLREFAKDVRVLGIIGTDPHAEKLKAVLAGEGINLDYVHQDPAYQTIIKTRIIAKNQQVVRVDRESKVGLSPAQIQQTLLHLEEILPQVDAVIVEDYAKGLVRQTLADTIAPMVARAGKILAIDPNPENLLDWKGVTVMKPNRVEAIAAAGRPLTDPVEPVQDDQALMEVGRLLLQKWDADNLLITLGEQGMVLFPRDGQPYYAPTRAREVFDVSGAGDTVIALFTMALCSGATPAEAAEISNHGSGVVVGKLGTATVSPHELLESFDSFE